MYKFFKENKFYVGTFIVLTVLFIIFFIFVKSEVYRFLSFIVYTVLCTISFKISSIINSIKKGDGK